MGCTNSHDENPLKQSSSSQKNKTLPGSNGAPLDLLVVADDDLWKGAGGEAFQKHFSSAQYGIPQPEPRYDVRQVEAFDFSSLLKRSRLIFILDVNPKGQTGYAIDTNRWAYPQYVFYLKATTGKKLAQLIEKHQEGWRYQARKQEIQHVQKRILQAKSKEKFAVLEKHNLAMRIPRGFKPGVNKENIAVLWRKTNQYDQGIIIYTQPLYPRETVLGSNIIELRDSLTKAHVPAQREGSYMITELELPPQIKNSEMAGAFAFETRGLWKAVNDIMGGSFINYTVYDEENEQMIFLDAYMYGPSVKKRNYLLELEAVLKTLKIRR